MVGVGNADLASRHSCSLTRCLGRSEHYVPRLGNLLFKLSLAEALEEVASSIAEEAWLYYENAFYFCFDYIHCFIFCS